MYYKISRVFDRGKERAFQRKKWAFEDKNVKFCAPFKREITFLHKGFKTQHAMAFKIEQTWLLKAQYPSNDRALEIIIE